MTGGLSNHGNANAESSNSGEPPLLPFPEKSDGDKPGPAFTKCLKKAHESLDRCGKVIFLREKMAELGCYLPREAFVCRPCGDDLSVSGGWNPGMKDRDGKPSPEIVLCEDKEMSQKMVNHTLAHELIHAFDQCRIKINWDNCLHHACSEVRASNTSGECNMMEEWKRGNIKWANGQQSCVKRRAELSLKMNPKCADRAREYVETAFESCYEDTEPYDKNPWY
ncbi:unnamed protein product [Sphacelaria rigidula]